ncbi:MAG: response regulator [Halobacteriota archaeon]|nr:response regulator [Halobacteriota archaeon]
MSEEASRKKIMVVDDTKDMVWTVKQMLGSEGYEMMEAGGGLECLQKLYEAKKKPDLILLDVMMHPMDGWVTLRTIKNDDKLKHIPVSMLTALPPDEEVIGSNTISMIENYIVKPFTKAELLEKVDDVFKQMDSTGVVVKNLKEMKIPEVADEYEHLATELLRRKRVVESMEKSRDLDLVSDRSSMEDLVSKQKEMIRVMEKRIGIIREKYGV